MKNLLRLSLPAALLLLQTTVSAGVFEVGASASYRSSHIDKNNYQTSDSLTASVSYYFWEMSALELSYTSGVAEVVTKYGADPSYIITTGFNMYGLDLVFTFAGREAPVQPYVKMGAAQISKEFYRQVEGNEKTKIGSSDGTAPSTGIGCKILLTKTFSIKLSLEAWLGADEDIDNANSDNVDYAARAGLSWLF